MKTYFIEATLTVEAEDEEDAKVIVKYDVFNNPRLSGCSLDCVYSEADDE